MKKPIQKIQLISLDLDGTLLNNAKELTPRTKEVLERAIEAGTIIVPATGRSVDGISEQLLSIPGISYAITANGAAVCRLPEKTCIYQDSIDPKTALSIMQELMELGVMVSLFLDGHGLMDEYSLKLLGNIDIPQVVKDYIIASRHLVPSVVDYLNEHQPAIDKFTINFPVLPDGTLKNRDQVRAFEKRYPQLAVVSGGVGNLEFTNRTATKGNALLRLADLLGISREATMACGDSENDLSMIKAAGLGVAMSNAEDIILGAADAVTLSNEEDGVAAAIEKYVLS